jgi:hypothetical protein
MLEGYPAVPMFISLFTGIAALLILYAFHLKKPIKFTFENLIYASMGWLILLGLTIPMFRGMSGLASHFIDNLTSRRSFFITSINTLYVILIGVLFVLIAKKFLFKGMSTKAFVFLAIFVGLCLKLAYVYLIDVMLVSDFRSMWRVVTETITAGWPERVTHVHQQRVLLFLVPLARLFGNPPLVYKIGNAVILMLSSLVSFSLARRWFGENAARASLVLILLVPETFFSLCIPTHDIPGAFLFLCSLWMLDTLLLSIDEKSWIACLITGLFLGISAEFLEIQRDISPVFWLAVLMFIAYRASQTRGILPSDTPKKIPLFSNKRAYLILLFVFFSFLASKGVYVLLESNGLILSDKVKFEASIFDFLKGSDSWEPGTYIYQWENYNYYTKNGNLYNSSIAVDKILSDTYYNSFDRISNYLMRAERLYRLGSQAYFYYGSSIQLPSSRLKGEKIEFFLTNHNMVFVLFFEMAFILSSILMLITNRINPRAFPSVLTLSFLSGALLIFGENQPRYMYPIWFIAPMLMAAQLGARPSLQTKQPQSSIKNNILVFIRGALIFLAITCFLFSAVHLFAHFSERRYLDMTEWTQLRTNYRVDNAKKFFRKIQSKYKGQRHFRLTLGHARVPEKGDRVSASHIYQLNDDAPRQFRVAVYPPYRAQDLRNAAQTFNVLILINNRVAERSPLRTTKYARWFEIKNIIPKNRKVKIEFVIEANLDAPDDLWRKLSFANFEFAQLMKQKR